jgi:hypothetical protein
MNTPARMPTVATAILAAFSNRLVSGGGSSGARGGGAESATPSTLLPQRQDIAGGATRRPQAGQTRLKADKADTAIYEKILT